MTHTSYVSFFQHIPIHHMWVFPNLLSHVVYWMFPTCMHWSFPTSPRVFFPYIYACCFLFLCVCSFHSKYCNKPDSRLSTISTKIIDYAYSSGSFLYIKAAKEIVFLASLIDGGKYRGCVFSTIVIGDSI